MSPINKISIPIKPTSKIIKKIKVLLEKPKRLLATILISNNFINIAIVILFASIDNPYLSSLNSLILEIILEVGLILLPSSLGILDLSSEKNATSHPEVRADNIRKIKIKIIFTITKI